MIAIAKNFQTNIVIGGKINPSLYGAFGAIAKQASAATSLINKVNSTADKAKEKISSTISTVARVGKTAAIVGGVVSGAALLGGKAMMNQAGDMEQYRNTLNIVMKDQKKAAETFKWAVAFANKTPYQTDEVVQATVKLTNYGLQAKKTLPLIGDMASVMGKSMDQAVEAVADAQTGELERLKEFGITKQMIVEQGEKKLAGIELVNKKGQIVNQKAFNLALFSLMQERYKGGMEIQSKTYKGLMSTIQGIWKNGIARIAGISDTGEIIKGSMFDVVKEKISKLSDVLLKMQENGSFEKIQQKLAILVNQGFNKLEECMPSIIQFGKNILDNSPQIFSNILDGVNKVGDLAKKVIDFGTYLSTDGPGIIDTIKFIGEGFVAWKVITGIAESITLIKELSLALGALNTKYIAVGIAKAKDIIDTGILMALYAKDAIVVAAKTVALWGLAIAQGALNVAMTIGTAVAGAFGAVMAFLTSPIGLVVLAIGLVVGAIYLLYKNWDSVCNFMVSIWENYVGPFFAGIGAWFSNIWSGVVSGFMWAWNGVTNWFKGLWNGLVDIAKGAANFLIKPINWLIDGLNKISFKIPDWVPDWLGGGKTIGVSIPNIPTFANGGIAKQASIFGEAGPEMAIPLKPKNARSIGLLNKTAKLLGVDSQGSKGGNIYNFSPVIQGGTEKLRETLQFCYEDFVEFIEQYEHEKERESYA